MLRFLLMRVGWLAITLWAVFTISFFLMRAVPGGPFDEERDIPQALRRQIEARYHLDQSLLRQYWSHLASYLRFDPGPSYQMTDYTVAEVIREGFPRSAILGSLALLFAVVVGITAGSLAALGRGGALDSALMLVANLGLALPNFVVAGLLIVVFSFLWMVLPPAGWGGFRELVLPSVCLGAPFAAAIARLARTGLLEVLGQDFVRTAYAKGLRPSRVVLRHALRLALLPVVSFLGPATAGVLTGSLVIEKIFAIPGMGSHFIQSALNRDYTLAMGVVVFYTLVVSTLNLLVDLSYRLLDPRVRLW